MWCDVVGVCLVLSVCLVCDLRDKLFVCYVLCVLYLLESVLEGFPVDWKRKVYENLQTTSTDHINGSHHTNHTHERSNKDDNNTTRRWWCCWCCCMTILFCTCPGLVGLGCANGASPVILSLLLSVAAGPSFLLCVSMGSFIFSIYLRIPPANKATKISLIVYPVT